MLCVAGRNKMGKRQWASWLLAGLMALGQTSVVSATTAAPTGLPALTVADAVAQGPVVLTRAVARKEVMALRAIENASRDEQKAFEDWQNALRRAEQLDTEKMIVKNPFTGEDIKIVFSDKVQMQQQQAKFVLPMQLELGYRASSMGTSIVIASLENAMDSLLLGLHSAQNEVRSKERSLGLAEQTLARTKASLKAGRAIELDVEADALAVRKATAAVAAARRSRENLVRSYNQFVGMPLERQVDVRLTPENSLPALSGDDYVLNALENRLELFQTRGSIPILEKQAEIMTFRDLHIYDPDIALDREGVVLQLEQTKTRLVEQQRSITAEIRAAFLRLQLADLDIRSTRDTLARQKARLQNIQTQIKAGRMPEYADDALLAAISDIEAGIVTARLALDKDVRLFRQATVYGTGS
jgi:hypothetical protein